MTKITEKRDDQYFVSGPMGRIAVVDDYKKATLKKVAEENNVKEIRAHVTYNGNFATVHLDGDIYFIMQDGEIVFTDGTDPQTIWDCMGDR